jgi:hypothetical protein
MLRLIDTRSSPPGGFQHSEHGFVSRRDAPESLWNFRVLCRAVQKFRSQHPEFGLELDIAKIELELDCANARRVYDMPGGHVHTRRDGSRVISRVFRPGSHPRGSITMRRSMALGDVTAASCVAKKLAELGFGVTFQSIPDCQPILSRMPHVAVAQTIGGTVDIDLDNAYESHGGRRTRHFYDIFTDSANAQLEKRGIKLPSTNLAPKMVLEPGETDQFLKSYADCPRPWTMICPKSTNWPHRTVPSHIWEQTVAAIQGTKFWLGMDGCVTGVVDCYCRHFDDVISLIGCADLLVTVDTGPMHVAAALGVPVVAICQSSSPELHLSDQQDFITISPALDCLNCQLDKCPINPFQPPCQNVPPGLIAEAVNKRLQTATKHGVSAIVPILKPPASRLNRCLSAVVDQVDEVIVTMEGAAVIPDGAMVHPKIRYVRKSESGIGLGRNINFGARHSNHEWLLLLNDDVFLEPDVVGKLMACVDEKTGMVAHLLRYPDGIIQHGGTRRTPGDIGWGHIDHRSRIHTITEVTEMENVTGASVLVRRKAFYQAGCFDEDFHLYCEDNALGLQLRQCGWKIMYTPHACAIHEEHQSTFGLPNITNVINNSCKMLEEKWGWYFEKNRNNNMGTFD